MITGAAFCPHPPVLVPELARGAAPELADLRAACRVAIRRVAAPGTQLVVVGTGPRWQHHPADAHGSLAGYGVALDVPLGADAAGPVELPLSLTIGAWLLRDALGPACGAVGESVGDGDGELRLPSGRPVALLVMGDGSARRAPDAPGAFDERSSAFDAGVVRALAAGDPVGLRTDVALGDELLAAGPRAWRAAAGLLAGTSWRAELLYDAAPYGVGYFVAAWTADA